MSPFASVGHCWHSLTKTPENIQQSNYDSPEQELMRASSETLGSEPGLDADFDCRRLSTRAKLVYDVPLTGGPKVCAWKRYYKVQSVKHSDGSLMCTKCKQFRSVHITTKLLAELLTSDPGETKKILSLTVWEFPGRLFELFTWVGGKFAVIPSKIGKPTLCLFCTIVVLSSYRI